MEWRVVIIRTTSSGKEYKSLKYFQSIIERREYLSWLHSKFTRCKIVITISFIKNRNRKAVKSFDFNSWYILSESKKIGEDKSGGYDFNKALKAFYPALTAKRIFYRIKSQSK